MKHQNRLINSAQEQQTQQSSHESEVRQQSGHQFASAEEMLRHDALHTPVPPGIAQRLQQSLKEKSPPTNSWWRKLFGS